MAKWTIKAAYEVAWDAHAVYMQRGDDEVTGFTLVPRDKGQMMSRAIPSDGDDDGMSFLRAALNCAWDMGLRPDGYLDTRESMKATTAHLQDMRAIAFHKVGAQKP